MAVVKEAWTSSIRSSAEFASVHPISRVAFHLTQTAGAGASLAKRTACGANREASDPTRAVTGAVVVLLPIAG